MRIKRSRLVQCHHRTAVPQKDKEGNSYLDYGIPTALMVEMWPAGGKIQAEIYGKRLAYIRNCRINSEYTIATDCKGNTSYQIDEIMLKEDDGICINAPKNSMPDYKIVAIRPYRYLTLEVEQVR